MSVPGPRTQAVPVTPDETGPTLPDPADAEADAERVLRHDLVLLSVRRRPRRRRRRLR